VSGSQPSHTTITISEVLRQLHRTSVSVSLAALRGRFKGFCLPRIRSPSHELSSSKTRRSVLASTRKSQSWVDYTSFIEIPPFACLRSITTHVMARQFGNSKFASLGSDTEFVGSLTSDFSPKSHYRLRLEDHSTELDRRYDDATTLAVIKCRTERLLYSSLAHSEIQLQTLWVLRV
jgi:hypothetical protein